MENLFEAVKTERLKYSTIMRETECVNLINSVAWFNRDDGWGISGKDFGNFARRYDGTPCAVDILHHRPSNVMVDCLIGAGAGSEPTWNVLGENTQTNRPWTAPIEHREPAAPVILKTKLGASLFSAVDLFQHERGRGEETLRRLRDELGATFIRVMWRKGTGAQGDFWNNDGYYSLVRSDLNQLPVSLMKETMDWIEGHGLSIAHCVFADNLGMSMWDQERFVDGFLEAEARYRNVTEYVEVFNEPYMRDGGGHGGYLPDLQHLARRLRSGLSSSSVLLALGTPEVHAGVTGNELEAQVRDMRMDETNLITVHFPRDTNRPPELGSYAPRQRSSGEPRGPDSSVSQTDDPATLIEDYRATNRAGYEWYVFHAGTLIRPRGQNIWEIDNWAQIAQAFSDETDHTTTPVKPKTRDNLDPGERLLPNQELRSQDGRFAFAYQDDGNLVLYADDGDEWHPTWSSGTNTNDPGELAMQGDGNLVIYNEDGRPVWASGTDGYNGAKLHIQNDGNVVIYLNGVPLWNTGTNE